MPTDTSEDLLDLLESDEKPFVQPQQPSYQKKEYGNKGFQSQKPNLWEKTDFKITKIDASTFDKTKSLYSIILVKSDKPVPEAIVEKAKSLAVLLNSKGFKYRHGSDGNDEFQNGLVKLPDFKYESFLPWKKFNPLVIPDAKLSEQAYNIAFSTQKNFVDRPSTIRAILAKDIQVMLGEDCRHPLTMLIVYSECGSDKISKEMDFKKVGQLPFYFKICAEANIPVFNIKSEESFKQLVNFIKFKLGKTEE